MTFDDIILLEEMYENAVKAAEGKTKRKDPKAAEKADVLKRVIEYLKTII